VLSLRGFHRVTLKPGEKAALEFPLTPDALSILDSEMRRVVEPGMFDILVGASSTETSSVPLEVRQP
jgi:beta-glucosidase